MRIPTSTIVMGLVTCIPFALAIRGGAPSHRGAPDDEVDGEEMMSREAQQRAMAADERVREELARDEQLHRLYGTEPATPGTLFAGISLGMPEVPPELERRVRAFARAAVELQTDDNGLFQIDVKPHQELCDDLDRKLSDTWGPGTVTPAGTVWLNPATSQRAMFDHAADRACALTFNRYATAETWIDKSESSVVPLWALGQPAEKLVDALTRPPSEAKAKEIAWTGAGIGASGGRTQLTADVEHGRITGIVAMSTAAPSTVSEIRGQLVALFGEPKPPASPDDDAMRWAGKLPILLESTDHGFVLSIGAAAKRAK